MFAHRAAARQFLPLGLFCLMFLIGCGYGEVSPKTYEYAKALYSICNRKDAGRLDVIETQIKEDTDAGQLNEQEADWLLAIVEDARQADWQAAGQAARRMMEDQIR